MKLHSKGVKDLEARTRPGEIRESELEYKAKNNTRVIGEIDHLVYEAGNLWIFEYKCTDRPKNKMKAIRQLTRARDKFVPWFEEKYGVKVDKFRPYYATPGQVKYVKL